jgi:malate permease and related proteins
MTILFSAYLATLIRLLPMIVCVGAGFVWGRRAQPYPTSFVSTLVTYIAIPALVFYTLMTTPLGADEMTWVLGVSTVALLLGGALVALILRLFNLPGQALGQTAWIPNAGNLGLPMAELVFGVEGLTVAIAFFAASSFVSFTLGLRWLTGSAGKVWRQPVVWATVIAIAARYVDLYAPSWLLESAKLLGSMAVPLMLLTLGHTLSQLPRAGLKDGVGVAAARFGSGAIVAVLLFLPLGLSSSVAAPIALQMLMPCAVNSYLFARLHSDRGDAAAGAILISTLAFLLLAPLMIWLAGLT